MCPGHRAPLKAGTRPAHCPAQSGWASDGQKSRCPAHASSAMLVCVWGGAGAVGRPCHLQGLAKQGPMTSVLSPRPRGRATSDPRPLSGGLTQNKGNLQDTPIPHSLQVSGSQTRRHRSATVTHSVPTTQSSKHPPAVGGFTLQMVRQAQRAEDPAHCHPGGGGWSQRLDPGPGDSRTTPSGPQRLAE